MRIRIDTTANGAAIEEAVVDFPLLVRLDTSRFAFPEARSDGADIRFLGSDGRALPHQIERWDAAGGVAEIWVRVPEVAPARSDNTLLMYWGNPLAVPVSSGPAVFGSFACVLHMAAAANDVAWHLEDSSVDGGVASVQNGTAKGPSVPGIAGTAMVFDGTTYLATSARTAAPVSVSFWMRTTATTGGGLAAFSSKAPYGDNTVNQAVRMDGQGRLVFEVLRGSQLDSVATLSSYHDDAWHFVVTRLSDAGQYLLVDGEPVAETTGRAATSTSGGAWRFAQVPSTAATADAASVPTQSFSGALDEVRVAPFAASDAWVKLAWATQRPDAVAVSYLRLP